MSMNDPAPDLTDKLIGALLGFIVGLLISITRKLKKHGHLGWVEFLASLAISMLNVLIAVSIADRMALTSWQSATLSASLALLGDRTLGEMVRAMIVRGLGLEVGTGRESDALAEARARIAELEARARDE